MEWIHDWTTCSNPWRKCSVSFFSRLNPSWYVARKELQSGNVIVVPGPDHFLLWTHQARVKNMNWVSGCAPSGWRERKMHVEIKHRYRMQPVPAEISHLPDGSLQLDFQAPQWSMAPGQHVAVYKGDVCLGGGSLS